MKMLLTRGAICRDEMPEHCRRPCHEVTLHDCFNGALSWNFFAVFRVVLPPILVIRFLSCSVC